MLTINKIQESSSSSSNMDKEDEKCQYFLQAMYIVFSPPLFYLFNLSCSLDRAKSI